MQVLATAPGPWDRLAAGAPAGLVVVARDEDGAEWICGGYIPCGACPPCNGGLQLACTAARRLQGDPAGLLAETLDLPPASRAPLPANLTGRDHVAMAALVAAAGTTYMAMATVGMAPGDAVLFQGAPGPGALPLQLLAWGGLRVTWLAGPPGAPGLGAPGVPDSEASGVPDSVLVVDELPRAADLPSPRIHLIDLAPSRDSLARLAELAPASLSCTLLCSSAPPGDIQLERLLGGGPIALRCLRDLHPHLLLELGALALDGSVEILPWVQRLEEGSAPPDGVPHRWPVHVFGHPPVHVFGHTHPDAPR
jgi:hypothetical protein